MGCEEEGRLVRAIRIAPAARRRPRRRRRLPTPTLPHPCARAWQKERREAVSSAEVARRRGIPCDAQEIGCRGAHGRCWAEGSSKLGRRACGQERAAPLRLQRGAWRPTHRPRSKSARGSLQERKRGEHARPPSYFLQTLLFSYAAISTRVYPSHPNREYKLVRARVVLRWGTTREGRVLHIFVLFCCAGAREAGPTSLTPFCTLIDTGR